jgi:hypothetical protein
MSKPLSEPRPPVVALCNLHGAHLLLLGVRAGWGYRACRVGRMVQQGVDLVHEEGIQLLGDLLLISEGEGAFEGDPFLGG